MIFPLSEYVLEYIFLMQNVSIYRKENKKKEYEDSENQNNFAWWLIADNDLMIIIVNNLIYIFIEILLSCDIFPSRYVGRKNMHRLLLYFLLFFNAEYFYLSKRKEEKAI